MAIRAGDVVKLKSGGAKMVVSHFSEDGSMVQVYWQNVTAEGAEARGNAYPLVTLELADPQVAAPSAAEPKGKDAKVAEVEPVAEVVAPSSGRRAWHNPRS